MNILSKSTIQTYLLLKFVELEVLVWNADGDVNQIIAKLTKEVLEYNLHKVYYHFEHDMYIPAM